MPLEGFLRSSPEMVFYKNKTIKKQLKSGYQLVGQNMRALWKLDFRSKVSNVEFCGPQMITKQAKP